MLGTLHNARRPILRSLRRVGTASYAKKAAAASSAPTEASATPEASQEVVSKPKRTRGPTKKPKVSKLSPAEEASKAQETAEITKVTKALRAPKPKPSVNLYKAATPVAEQLAQTNIWKKLGATRRVDKKAKVLEKRRVNLVSEELCDDILDYIGPSLERHRGCDLIDLNPGAGVWSKKLHGFLEPRKHVMMDLDGNFYSKELLADFVAKDNVTMLTKTGIVWKDLHAMMDEHLSHQKIVDTNAEPKRNDTLLVTANLAQFPKVQFSTYEDIAGLVLYQFISSIRNSTLFQRYGLVRMLIWVNDDDTRRVLPRSLSRRHRGQFEAEMSCEWIHEVVGADTERKQRTRDMWIDIESAARTLEKMEAANLHVPTGRETRATKLILDNPELRDQKLVNVKIPLTRRPFQQELDDLENSGKLTEEEDIARLVYLRLRHNTHDQEGPTLLDLIQRREALFQQCLKETSEGSFPTADFTAASERWNAGFNSITKNQRVDLLNFMHSAHLFRGHSPPALLWDRRAYEPLKTQPTEFFPNAPTSLLDIQPKAMNPLFRQFGPKSTRSGDMSELMLRFLYHQTIVPVAKAMEGLWPGFGESIKDIPSVRDPSQGGSPLEGGDGALVVREMGEAQWAEVVKAWMDWPFRPTYNEMLGRLLDEAMDSEDDDDK